MVILNHQAMRLKAKLKLVLLFPAAVDFQQLGMVPASRCCCAHLLVLVRILFFRSSAAWVCCFPFSFLSRLYRFCCLSFSPTSAVKKRELKAPKPQATGPGSDQVTNSRTKPKRNKSQGGYQTHQQAKIPTCKRRGHERFGHPNATNSKVNNRRQPQMGKPPPKGPLSPSL